MYLIPLSTPVDLQASPLNGEVLHFRSPKASMQTTTLQGRNRRLRVAAFGAMIGAEEASSVDDCQPPRASLEVDFDLQLGPSWPE